MSTTPDSLIFFGRMHPALVHFPIALILLVGALELFALRPRMQHLRTASCFVLVVGLLSSVLAAGCGWLLSITGGYEPHLLALHKWTGIATTGVCLLAVLALRFNLRRVYLSFLSGGIILLVVASHFGGTLTHGRGYLAQHAPGFLRSLFAKPPAMTPIASTDLRQVSAFTAVIQPVLEKNCVACHGPEKSKGSLRLDSYEAMLKGGESGPAVVPGSPEQSLLIKRLLLPPENEDHMPPEAKPQPNEDDLALLQWWIATGASGEAKIAELQQTPKVERIVQGRYGAL